MALVFLLYGLFASVFTLSKVALEYSSPFFLIGSRMTAAGILMLGYMYLFQRQSFKVNAITRIFLLAFFNIYLTNICEYWGLQYLTTFKTCFIYSLSPFVSALLCFLLFRETLTQKKWLGLLVGCTGFFPILLSMSSLESLSGEFFIFSFAELAVIVAAISSVYGWILLGRLVKENELHPLMANGLSMLLGGIMSFTHSFFFEDWNPLPITALEPFLETTCALMIISNLLAYNLYGFLLKQYSQTFLSFAGFTTPIFTALFGWLFLGEIATMSFYISAALVFMGLLLFHQEELKKGIVVA